MARFDESKAYAEQGDTFFNDGRDLHYVYSRQNIDQLRQSPSKVLDIIDEFGREQKYLMNVGADKGSIVTDLVSKSRPKVMIELGGYVGYSDILFGDAARRAGGLKYICLERDPLFAAVASSLIHLAELGSFVEVIVGPSSGSIQRLYSEGQLTRIDMMFLDHYKPAYLTDLKLCERLGLIGQDSVVTADNVIKPGNPPYLKYVRGTTKDKRQATRNDNMMDVFGQKWAGQYGKEANCADDTGLGDPSLQYQNELIHSFEPTGMPEGIEVTRCIGKETAPALP